MIVSAGLPAEVDAQAMESKPSLAGRRIVINALAAKAGGFYRFMVSLVAELSRHDDGARYLVLLPSQTVARTGPGDGCVEVRASRRIAGSPWLRTVWEQIGLPRAAVSWGADTIVSASSHGPAWPGRRHVVWLRNSLPFSPEYEALIAEDARERLRIASARWRVQLATRRAWRVVVQQEAMIARVRRYLTVPSECFRVIPNAPLPPFGNTRVGVARLRARYPSAFVVNGCQYYHRYRNLETLLNAAELVAGDIPDLLLLLSVDPREEGHHSARFVARVAASPLARAGRLLNFGRLTPAEVQALYHQSDVAAFPSIAESFSNAYLDALTAGCAIIATDLDFAHGVFGDAALYFDPGNPQSLAWLLLGVGKDPARVDAGRARARARAAAFSWDRTLHAFRTALV